MFSENLEQLLKGNKSLLAPWTEFHKAGTDVFRRLFEKNLSLLSADFEILSQNCALVAEQLEKISHARKPEELATTIRECINENINTAIENSQRMLRTRMEHCQEAIKTVSDLQEASVKAAVKEKEKVKERI